MNLLQAINNAVVLADCYESDYPFEKYTTYADIAQKKIATLGKHIIKNISLTVDTDEGFLYTLPEESIKLHKIKVLGSDQPVNYEIIEKNKIIIYQKGKYNIYYFSNPITIDTNTSRSYEFETDEETHIAIPFYMAYCMKKDENTVIAQTCLNEWNRLLSLFCDENKATLRQVHNYYGF